MSVHVLDNPIFESLGTRHQAHALTAGAARRFPREIAPFLGLPAASPEHSVAVDEAALAALLEPAETVFLIGPRPTVPADWRVEDLGRLVQMIAEAPPPPVEGPPLVELTHPHRPAVLALTARVYPHYFRPRTMDLGRYFGILEGEALAAMIGERMAMPGYREVSAVCTAPEHGGRGLARRLLTGLSADLCERGEVPFLHVSPANTRAVELYQQNGYRQRALVPFWSLRRHTPV
jgi:ribosomal protein S18 acetylase RimI-like enzyme